MAQFSEWLSGVRPLTGSGYWFNTRSVRPNQTTGFIVDSTANYNGGKAPWAVDLNDIKVDFFGNVVSSGVLQSYNTGSLFTYRDIRITSSKSAVFWTSAVGTYPASKIVDLNVEFFDNNGTALGSPTKLLSALDSPKNIYINADTSSGTSFFVGVETVSSGTATINVQSFSTDGTASSSSVPLASVSTTYNALNELNPGVRNADLGFNILVLAKSSEPVPSYALLTHQTIGTDDHIIVQGFTPDFKMEAQNILSPYLPSGISGVKDSHIDDYDYVNFSAPNSNGYNFVTAFSYHFTDSSDINIVHQLFDIQFSSLTTSQTAPSVIKVHDDMIDTSGYKVSNITDTGLPNGNTLFSYTLNGTTYLREYGPDGNVIGASQAMPSYMQKVSLRGLGDGRVIISWYTLDGAVDSNLGHYDYSIYDTRSKGLVIDDSKLVPASGSGFAIAGTLYDDTITGSSGNDSIDGGAGNNTVIFSGPSSNYTITNNSDGSTTVKDISTGSPNGTDTLTHIQNLMFAEKTSPTSTPVVNSPVPPLFAVTNTTTSIGSDSAGSAYTGPVVGLKYQYIYTGSDSQNISVGAANSFIHTGSGFDAIDVSSVGGSNVLDGGTNSNFLVGGTATTDSDTFFIDDRSPPGDIWSTVGNFHAGDAATIFGITQTGFTTTWVDGEGAAGFTGL